MLQEILILFCDYSVFPVQAAQQPNLNSLRVCSSCYSLWTDEANCLLSYLHTHTKGNSESGKMDSQQRLLHTLNH